MPFLPIMTVYSVFVVFVMLYRTFANRNDANHVEAFDISTSSTSTTKHRNDHYLTLLLMMLFALAELNGASPLWLHCIGASLLISTIVACMIAQSKYTQLVSDFLNIALIVGLGLTNLFLCWPYVFRS